MSETASIRFKNTDATQFSWLELLQRRLCAIT